MRRPMTPVLENAPIAAPLPAWACIAALIQAVLLFASLTLVALS